MGPFSRPLGLFRNCPLAWLCADPSHRTCWSGFRHMLLYAHPNVVGVHSFRHVACSSRPECTCLCRCASQKDRTAIMAPGNNDCKMLSQASQCFSAYITVQSFSLTLLAIHVLLPSGSVHVCNAARDDTQYSCSIYTPCVKYFYVYIIYTVTQNHKTLIAEPVRLVSCRPTTYRCRCQGLDPY